MLMLIESSSSQAQIKLKYCRHSAHSRFTKLIHHLSSDQSGQGAARHGMQHNIAHILILPLLHQRDMKIIQLRSAGDFSCALRELRLLLLSPPASAGGELAYKDTFPPEEEEEAQLEDLPLLYRGGVLYVQLSINYLKFINYSFK